MSRCCSTLTALAALLAALPAQTPPSPAPTARATWWHSRAPRVGDEAPPWSCDATLREERTGPAPELASFRGKVVLLEFSAGWCGPCRVHAPELAKLAAELRPEDGVELVTVTNEPEAAARAFRRETGLPGTVAFDRDGSTWSDYWVGGVPAAFVIDRAGRIVGITHPAHITAERLRAVAAGKAADFPPAEGEPTPSSRPDWDMSGVPTTPAEVEELQRTTKAPPGLEGATAYAVLRRAKNVRKFHVLVENPTAWNAHGVTAHELLMGAFGVELEQLVDPDGVLDETAWNIDVRTADGKVTTAQRVARELILASLGLDVRVEDRPTKVELLRRRADAPPLPAARDVTGQTNVMAGDFDLPATTVAEFAALLRNIIGLPIHDDTGDTERHSIRLQWNLLAAPDASDGLHTRLRALGFDLRAGTRSLPHLIVTRRKQ